MRYAADDLAKALQPMLDSYLKEFETPQGRSMFQEAAEQCLSATQTQGPEAQPPGLDQGSSPSPSLGLSPDAQDELRACLEEAFREARLAERRQIWEGISVRDLTAKILAGALEQVKKVIQDRRRELEGKLPDLIDEAKRQGPMWVAQVLGEAKASGEELRGIAKPVLRILTAKAGEGKLGRLRDLVGQLVEHTDSFINAIDRLLELFSQKDFEGYIKAQGAPQEPVRRIRRDILIEIMALRIDRTPIPAGVGEQLSQVLREPISTVGDAADAIYEHTKDFLDRSAYPIARRSPGGEPASPQELRTQLEKEVSRFFDYELPQQLYQQIEPLARSRAQQIKDELEQHISNFDVQLESTATAAAEEAADGIGQQAAQAAVQITYYFTLRISASVMIMIYGYTYGMPPPPSTPGQRKRTQQQQQQ